MGVKNRANSGIFGLDELMEGGLPTGSVTLLSGTCGTGKSIFGMQFIYFGAKAGEPGVFISFEESPESIKSNVSGFGWDIEKLERENKIIIIRLDPFHVEDIYDLVESAIKKIKAKRVVIDSISALGLYIRDPPEIRLTILNLSSLLRKLGCTSIITSEILPTQENLSRFGVEEFVADGVIILYYLRVDAKYARSLTVWKMRGTEHSQKLHPYAISKKGIITYPKEEAFVKK